MRVSLASSPGHAGRASEDFVGAVPGAVVLLDGAAAPGVERVCRHGAAWYAQVLGTTLLGLLAADTSVPLPTVLARSLAEVADRHLDGCDLADPRSPMATVAVLRAELDAVDVLVLADVFVVVEPLKGLPEVVTDGREVDVRRECMSVLDGVPEGTPEYAEKMAQVVTAFRARRNVPGGYWIAKDDPAAADQAITRRLDRSGVRSLSLLSNGASRLVDPYGATNWPSLVQDLRAAGPEALLRQLRDVEQEPPIGPARPAPLAPDDATVAYCQPDPPPAPAALRE